VVGTPIGDIKGAPVSSQAPSDSSAGLQIYKTEVPPPGEATPAPKFLPGPEQPTPRPVAQPAPQPIAAQPLRPAEPAPTVASLPAAKVVPQAPKAPPAAAKTVVAKQAPPSPKAVVAKQAPPAPKTSPAAPKTPPAARAAAATSSGGPLVQIGALSSPALADKAWSDVAKRMGGAMSGKTRKVETTSKDGKTFYRASVGGFADHAAAASFCAALKAKGAFCIVR